MRLSIVILAILSIFALLVLEVEPRIAIDDALQNRHVNLARDAMSKIQNSDESGYLAVELSGIELQALAASLSSLQVHTQYQFKLHENRFEARLQHQLNTSGLPLFVNIACEFEDQNLGVRLTQCELGKVTLPSGLAKRVVEQFLMLQYDQLGKDFFQNVLQGASISPLALTIVAAKPAEMQLASHTGLNSLHPELGIFLHDVAADSITTYLEYLATLSFADKSLSNWLYAALQLAQLSPNGLSSAHENRAAIWALAIFLGDGRFAQRMNQAHIETIPATLGGRRDLALHFIYSAVLYMVGNAEIATRIGQLKESSDALAGGSGYSFADLAADKAGLVFAEFATSKINSASTVQCVLSGTADETVFFPKYRDLPEGIRKNEFSAKYGNETSLEYAAIENLIDSRISALPLYREEYRSLCVGS